MTDCGDAIDAVLGATGAGVSVPLLEGTAPRALLATALVIVALIILRPRGVQRASSL